MPESRRPEEDAIRFATRLAREKAEEVFARRHVRRAELDGSGRRYGCGLRRGSYGQAGWMPPTPTRMLLLLSGRTHHVVTGVAVVWGSRAAARGSRGADPGHHADPFARRKSPTMWPAANPWIRREPMPSRDMPEGGFHGSTAATSTWSGCRWPWSPACWKEPSCAWPALSQQRTVPDLLIADWVHDLTFAKNSDSRDVHSARRKMHRMRAPAFVGTGCRASGLFRVAWTNISPRDY